MFPFTRRNLSIEVRKSSGCTTDPSEKRMSGRSSKTYVLPSGLGSGTSEARLPTSALPAAPPTRR